MLRVGARRLRSGDSQMGLPATVNICGTPYVGGETLGTEASKYEEEEKPRRDSQSSGEQNGKSPNRTLTGNCQGLWGYWAQPLPRIDRKSTRLNSSHVAISYAVFCLKKKRK